MVLATQICNLSKLIKYRLCGCVDLIAYKSYLNKVHFKRKERTISLNQSKGSHEKGRSMQEWKDGLKSALQYDCTQDKSLPYSMGTPEKWALHWFFFLLPGDSCLQTGCTGTELFHLVEGLCLPWVRLVTLSLICCVADQTIKLSLMVFPVTGTSQFKG